ncbi:Integrase [alpha proteobacterium BAL199]|jgi:integrase|nr:Integrase [alpha proteobacterium BAL199]
MPADADHKSYADYTDLRGDGRIVLYKRKDHGNPRWNVRIKVPGGTGYIVKSCRTTDFYEARRFSEDLYYQLEGRSRRGETIRAKPFQKVFDEWRKEYPATMRGRSDSYITGNIRRGELYLVPFFGKTPVERVDENLMVDYFVSRQSADPVPSNVTLRHEGTVLRHILTYAKRKGYIANAPDVPQPKMKVSPRPDITREEWQTLYTYLRRYVGQAQDKRRHRERFYLQHWILILGNTGIRVGEMRNVRWSDIGEVRTVEGEARVSISVSGKTGPRLVIANAGVETYLKRLRDFRTDELGHEPPSSEVVFCNRDGEPIHSFKKGFERVMSECGLLFQDNGQKRVPYSLRHTYATMRIAEGVNVYQLASNMGTSVDMIEMYYGKKRTSDPRNVSEITKIATHKK